MVTRLTVVIILLYIDNTESLCRAPGNNIVLQVNYTSTLKIEKRKTCSQSILIGSAVNNMYIVIMMQTYIDITTCTQVFRIAVFILAKN